MKNKEVKNTTTSAALSNEIRWEMTEIAGRLKKERFRLSDIISKDKAKRTALMQQVSDRWLQECFRLLIESGVFVKVQGKYLYEFNREQILNHSRAIQDLAN